MLARWIVYDKSIEKVVSVASSVDHWQRWLEMRRVALRECAVDWSPSHPIQATDDPIGKSSMRLDTLWLMRLPNDR